MTMDLSTLKSFAVIVFVLSTLFVCIISVILNYHWSNYSISALSLKTVQLIYILVMGGLLLLTTILFLNTLAS